jgi:hypothetical protein
MIRAVLFNNMKLQIWFMEGYEGRPRTVFTKPVKDVAPGFGALPGSLVGDPIYEQEIFEIRKALATDHISVFPIRRDYFCLQFFTPPMAVDHHRTGSRTTLSPFPPDSDVWEVAHDCGVVHTGVTGGSVTPELDFTFREHADGIVGMDIGANFYRFYRRADAFVMPSALPSIATAKFKVFFTRRSVVDEGTPEDIHLLLHDSYVGAGESQVSGGGNPPAACGDTPWGKTTGGSVGSFSPTIVANGVGPQSVEVAVSDVSKFLSDAFVSSRWVIASDLADVPLPMVSEVRKVDVGPTSVSAPGNVGTISGYELAQLKLYT